MPQQRQGEFFEYQVKKGDTLIKIMRHQLGIRGRYYRYLRKMILPHNSWIRNVHLIYPGQKIRLPVVEGHLPHAEESIPLARQLTMIQSLTAKLDGSLATTGQHIIPLSNGGEVRLSCDLTPIAIFPDGTVVILDFHLRLSRDVCALITGEWPNYRILPGTPSGDLYRYLTRLFGSVPGYKMIRVARVPLDSPRVTISLPATWCVTHERKLLIHQLGAGQEPFTPFLHHLLALGGYEVIEITERGEVMPPSPLTALPTLAVPSLPVADTRACLKEILTSLGYEFQAQDFVTVLNAEKDGMELVIPLLGTTEKRGIFYAFTEHPVPAHLHRLLQKKGMIAILITSTDPRLIVTQVSRHMGFKRMVTMSSFPLTAGAEVTLRFPVVCLRAKSGRMLQLIDFRLDPATYHHLATVYGQRFVSY